MVIRDQQNSIPTLLRLSLLLSFFALACSKATLTPRTVTQEGIQEEAGDEDGIEVDPNDDGNVEIQFNDYVVEIPAKAFTSKTRISVKSVAFTQFKVMGLNLAGVNQANGIEIAIYDSNKNPVNKLQKIGSVSRIMPSSGHVEGLAQINNEKGTTTQRSTPMNQMKVTETANGAAKYSVYSDAMFGKFIIFSYENKDQTIAATNNLSIRRVFLQTTSPLTIDVQDQLAENAEGLTMTNHDLGNMSLRLDIPKINSVDSLYDLDQTLNMKTWLYGSKTKDLKDYLRIGENKITLLLNSNGQKIEKKDVLTVKDFDQFAAGNTDPRPKSSEGSPNFQGWFDVIQAKTWQDDAKSSELTSSLESTLYQ